MPRVSRYSLSYKAATDPQAGPAARHREPNPAMATRPGNVELDQGRDWSGDLYDTGAPSDPEQAFAHFSGDEGVEAWLDRADDGTLTGWLRNNETGQVYRYTDADAWAIDVDGADLTRADSGPSPVDPAAGGPPAEEGEEEPVEGEPAPDEFTDTEDGQAPAEEPPPDTPPQDATGSDEPAAQGDHGGEHGRRYEAEHEFDEELDPDDEFNLFGGPHTRKRRSTEKKHNPGGHPHNQESHGNWSDGVSAPKAPAGGSSPGASGGSSSGSGSGQQQPQRKAPAQASISPETLAKMSDQQLEAVATSGDRYDEPTMFAVMEEMDSRDDAAKRFGGVEPRSAAEAAVFDSAFPAEWVAWVAHPERAKARQNKKVAARQAYDELIEAQFQQAEEDTNGNLLNKRGRREGINPRSLFRSRDKLRRYGSEELQRWFGAGTGNKHQTFEQFAADELGWKSYQRQRDKLESDYLSEHGG